MLLGLGFLVAASLAVGGDRVVRGTFRRHQGPDVRAFAVLLVWIYYAGMIVLFGAEFTQEWAAERGHGVAPAKGAVRTWHQRLDHRPAGDLLPHGPSRQGPTPLRRRMKRRPGGHPAFAVS